MLGSVQFAIVLKDDVEDGKGFGCKRIERTRKQTYHGGHMLAE